MEGETLTIVLFIINGLVGLVITFAGFALTRYVKENDKKWSEQRERDEKQELQIQEIKLNHQKNRADIEKLEQRERLIEAQNAEKFVEFKKELSSIASKIDKILSLLPKNA